MLPGNHYFMINCFPAQIAVEEFGGGLGAGGKVRHLMVEGKIRGAEPRARGVSGTDSRERAGAPAAGPGQVAAQRNGPVRGLRRKRGAGASRQAARGEFSPPNRSRPGSHPSRRITHLPRGAVPRSSGRARSRAPLPGAAPLPPQDAGGPGSAAPPAGQRGRRGAAAEGRRGTPRRAEPPRFTWRPRRRGREAGDPRHRGRAGRHRRSLQEVQLPA